MKWLRITGTGTTEIKTLTGTFGRVGAGVHMIG
jgi:hypothetical protein